MEGPATEPTERKAQARVCLRLRGQLRNLAPFVTLLFLVTFFALASHSSSLSERPTQMTPPMTAMVAGTAPPARTWLSSECAVARFSGYGMPWVMMVLSSATTGCLP